jgi:hypothetical protein
MLVWTTAVGATTMLVWTTTVGATTLIIGTVIFTAVSIHASSNVCITTIVIV